MFAKNLRRMEYNPCGELTGMEHSLCDEAAKNFYNLPFAEVMRAISIKALAETKHEKNFRNVDALEHWAAYNLSDDERRATLSFDTFTPFETGLAKYFVHVLFENRYNIHYNALADYCRTLDEKNFPATLTTAELERKINFLAQSANHSSRINTLIEELWNFFAATK